MTRLNLCFIQLAETAAIAAIGSAKRATDKAARGLRRYRLRDMQSAAATTDTAMNTGKSILVDSP
jgi:hypothetical protein